MSSSERGTGVGRAGLGKATGGVAGETPLIENVPPGQPSTPVVHHGGPPPAAVMDLGVQFRQLGPSSCLDPATSAELVAAIDSALRGNGFSNPFVKYLCCRLGSDNAATALGAWLEPPHPSELEVEGPLNALDLLGAGDTFAISISAAMLDVVAQIAWESAPKQINSDGKPDPDGSIQLTGLDLSFQTATSSVITEITGVDTTPVPDAPFTLTISDQLSDKFGQPNTATTRNLQVDRSFVDELEAIIVGAGFLAALCAPFFLAYVGFLLELIVVTDTGAPAIGGGVGAAAARLLITEVPLKKAKGQPAQTLTFLYDRVEVTDNGIVAAGLNNLRDRVPSVEISGAGPLRITSGSATVATFEVTSTTDLRPPIAYHWSGGSVSSPKSSSTQIEFLVGTETPGTALTVDVRLTATDADGLVATATTPVRLNVEPRAVGKPPPRPVREPD